MREGEKLDGRFLLKRKATSGARGEVWIAEDELVNNRPVVLKRPLPGENRAAERRRLIAEMRALTRFQHPHVVTLYDVYTAASTGDEWLVFEYVSDGSLDARPRMTVPEAAEVGERIAAALTALHGQGYVHCDVKPANILGRPGGTVKLADFGAAFRLQEAETITENGALSYTPDYAAPELRRGMPRKASDVFSLGLTLHQLVTGENPRSARRTPEEEPDGSTELWLVHRLGFDPARDVDHEALGALDQLVTAMLELDPADRPAPDAVRQQLSAVARSGGALAGALPPATRPRDGAAGEPVSAEAPGHHAEEEPGAGSSGAATHQRAFAFLVRHRWPTAAVSTAAAVILALVIVLPGAHGDPGPRHKAAPVPSFGSLRTADPCALMAAAPLDRYGHTKLDADYGGFNRCDILIGDSEDTDVELQLLDGSAPESARPSPLGRVRVVRDTFHDDGCGRTLLLPGDQRHDVEIVAKGKGGPKLCDMAETAAATAADVLGRKGQIPRRSGAFPKASLWHRNACSLLDGHALEAIPGVDAGDPEVDYGNWGCHWHSTTDDIDAALSFDRGMLPADPDGWSTELHGRQAGVEPEDNGCEVEIKYRKYTALNKSKVNEMVKIEATGQHSSQDTLCHLATRLASSAAAALPNP